MFRVNNATPSNGHYRLQENREKKAIFQKIRNTPAYLNILAKQNSHAATSNNNNPKNKSKLYPFKNTADHLEISKKQTTPPPHCNREKNSNNSIINDAFTKLSEPAQAIKHNIFAELALDKKANKQPKNNGCPTCHSVDEIKTDNKGSHNPEIVDLHKHFVNFNQALEEIRGKSINTDKTAFLTGIKALARSLEDDVKNHRGTDDSVEYFIVGDKLMQLTDALDKVRINNDHPQISLKVDVASFMIDLQHKLDANAAGNYDEQSRNVLKQQKKYTPVPPHRLSGKSEQKTAEQPINNGGATYGRADETKPENKTTPSLEIVNLQKDFVTFNKALEEVRCESIYTDKTAFLTGIEKLARSLESEVKSYRGDKYSREFFIVDEKLMQLIEALDKAKFDKHHPQRGAKINVIKFIKDLQNKLDANAT